MNAGLPHGGGPLKRHSDMQLTYQHIYDFITALPGGNVPQYSKLLNVSAARLNNFLNTTAMGKRLVKSQLIHAPLKGVWPNWATSKTIRGVLTADDAPLTFAALKTVVSRLPKEYQADAEHMFKMLIHMSSGKGTFSETINEIVSPYANLAIDHNRLQLETLTLRDNNEALRENIKLLREHQALMLTSSRESTNLLPAN